MKSYIRLKVCLTDKPKNKLNKLSSFANLTNLLTICGYVEYMCEYPSERFTEGFTQFNSGPFLDSIETIGKSNYAFTQPK